LTIIQCPVCQQALKISSTSWYCENNHQFDIAKQGYCNLLLANQKKSANPGDDRQMLEARHRFLNTGFYQPVVDCMTELVQQHISKPRHIIDIGCGEGYYLSALQQSLLKTGCQFYGTDISKDALKIAGREHKSISWFVAAARRQPFLDHSVDLALNIFAPGDFTEIKRLLHPGGHLLLTVAGDNHLQSLRELIYDQVKPHQPERFLQHVVEDFELIADKSCQFELQLEDNSAVRNLLQMTPYYWQADKARRESIENLQCLSTPVNFQFYLLQARQGQDPRITND